MNVSAKKVSKAKDKSGNGDAATELNEWTIMIYHSGNTDLSEEFIWALKEMVRVGTPDKVEVVALMGSNSPDLWMFTIPQGTAQKKDKDVDNVADQASTRTANIRGDKKYANLFGTERVKAEKINPKKWGVTPSAAKKQATTKKQTTAEQEKEDEEKFTMASSAFLKKFVTQCIKNHAAMRYMLILSGHGDGMVGETLLLDQGAGRYMSVPRLNWALGKILEETTALFKEDQSAVQLTYKKNFDDAGKDKPDPRIDILGFDACGMLTAEVAYLLKEEVKYIVASEGSMHRAGWPHHLILEYLLVKQNVEPKDLAIETARRTAQYYADFARVGVSVEVGVVEMDKVVQADKVLEADKVNSDDSSKYASWTNLVEALKSLTAKLSAGIKVPEEMDGNDETINWSSTDVPTHVRITNAVITAHWYAQSYALEEYVDLYDFCMQLAQASPDLRTECRAVIDAINNIVKKCYYTGGAFQHSHGLSLFFPWVPTDRQLSRYSFWEEGKTGLTPFNKATGWGNFLKEFTYATRRKERPGKGEMVFMPPPGYRDHLIHDTYAYVKPRSAAYHTTPARRVPPDPKRVPPDPRLTGMGSAFFAKIKNPSMVFHEFTDDDLIDKK